MSERQVSAGEALQAAAVAALRAVPSLGVQDGQPVQAALPFALVDAGLESEWGWKEGEGREVRLAVTIRDGGEHAARLRRLTAAAEAAMAGIGPPASGWRLVSLRYQRTRTVREAPGRWAAVLEYRARLCREAP